MQGLLLVDKPAGWTSFDVVNYVRKLVAQVEGKKPKNCKVGHTGTLDPFATGLLVLLVGKEYTKRAGELSKLDKTYEMTMRLGETSTTGDPEGVISAFIPQSKAPAPNHHPGGPKGIPGPQSNLQAHAPDNSAIPSLEALQQALKPFTGPIQQTPPAFSAIKIDGQRAYKLARAGKEVKIEPRQVTINRLEITDYNYPEVKLVANVSSGTYIRSLVEDLGETLGTGAYTTQLRRTRVGGYDVAQASSVDKSKSLDVESLLTELK